MRVVFASGNTHLPQTSGGVQSSTHQLAMKLLGQGHSAAVVCRLQGGGWTEISSRLQRRLRGARFSRDSFPGYPVFRAWDPADATEVVRRFQPDVAVVQHVQTMKIAKSFQSAGVPVVLYFRNVEFDELGGNPANLRNARYIANSSFTAEKYRSAFGISSTVIPPLVDPDQYSVTSSRENVTFINPYPAKGVDLAIAIAGRCPDVPFTFLESWTLDKSHRDELTARLARLPNVTLRPRTGDMKSVYGKARIVLAPSKWEEAWGRIATEAHCSGIPVLGSNRGGLPEAIGPGGIALDYEAPVDDWVRALRRMWDDEAEYTRLSAAAAAYAGRAEMNPEGQFAAFLGVLRDAAGHAAPAARQASAWE